MANSRVRAAVRARKSPGNVGRGDKQNERDDPKEDIERLTQRAGGELRQLRSVEGPVGTASERLAAFRANLLAHFSGNSGVYLRDSCAGTQTDKRLVVLVVTLVGRKVLGVERDGYPYLVAPRPVKVAAHHADHLIRLLIQHQGLADYITAVLRRRVCHRP